LKILLVEDNERVSQFVIKGLQEAGHTTDHAANGRDGMFLAASEPYDVIVMDRMLPGDIDGLAIIEVLRKAGKRTPILILSALSDVDDRIRGLRSGGDDYLTKPFAFGELLARLDALHRRAQGVNHELPLTVGNLHMDPMTRKVSRGDRQITLQPREFKLLEYLMRHADQVVTRFDHHDLNQDPEFADRTTTGENLVLLIWDLLVKHLPTGQLEKVGLIGRPGIYLQAKSTKY
jgi:two-component system OmpR family response regulator